ncbi:MAG: DNA-binding protein Alba [Thermoplasmata archaeon]|nr:MAG: DNA-binding protein Alba [Thermoplasmata archaeon]
MVEENFIFIGKKPLMSYVLAALRQINEADGTVVIKARGKAISRAVDVAEILRNQFATNATVDDIEISTERLTSDEGRESNVSSIEIFMSVPEGEGAADEAAAPKAEPKAEPAQEDTGADFFGEFKDQS